MKMNKVIFQIYPHFVKKMEQFYVENEKKEKVDIVFVGDSMIELFDCSTLNLPQYVIYNRGIISDKSAGVLMSFDDRVLALNPRLVVMEIGSNDVCDGYTLKQIQTNIEDIIQKLQKNNIPLILWTVLPPCYYDAPHVEPIYRECRDIEKMLALNEIIHSFANLYPNVYILDNYPLYADKNQSLKVEDTLDGIHLTPLAYQKLVPSLKTLILKVMEGNN